MWHSVFVTVFVHVCAVRVCDNVWGCLCMQVLITVPDCLELLLVMAIHAKWAQRIRWVIFDEVRRYACVCWVIGVLG